MKVKLYRNGRLSQIAEYESKEKLLDFIESTYHKLEKEALRNMGVVRVEENENSIKLKVEFALKLIKPYELVFKW